MNEEEKIITLKFKIPKPNEFQIKDGVDTGLANIKQINELILENNSEKYIRELLNRVDKLQNNWNELKKFVEDDIKYWEEQEKEWIKLGFMKFGGEVNAKHIFRKVLKKMQELEQGKDE